MSGMLRAAQKVAPSVTRALARSEKGVQIFDPVLFCSISLLQISTMTPS